ncbi:MAG: hypothetical protein AMXMBFR36_16330 [Acidobacteriota bacterium]
MEVPGLRGIVAVAAGDGFSLALDEAGEVWAWGRTPAGDSASEEAVSLRPRRVSGLAGITAIAAGRSFALAKRNDGTVWAWGANGAGQLGDGSRADRSSPAPVRLGRGAPLDDVVAIAASETAAVALRADGTAWRWGGTAGSAASEPRLIRGRDGATPSEDGLPGIGVAVAGDHLFELLSDGRVLAWRMELGQANGEDASTPKSPRAVPIRVVAEGGSAQLGGIVDLAAGPLGALLVGEDGSLWHVDLPTRGATSGPEAGLGARQVVAGPNGGALSEIRSAAAGEGHLFAVEERAGGALWAWGSNGSGQLGDGSTERRDAPVLVIGSGFTWSARAPRLEPSGGVFREETSVAIESPTPGSDVRLTAGERPLDPDADDASLRPDEIARIDRSTTLKARAWAEGLAPSPLTQASFELEVAPPRIDPPGGRFEAPTAVTIASETPGAEIRFTTDGTVPDEQAVSYLGPIIVDRSTALSAVAFRDGWTPSEVVTAEFELELGKLEPPTVSPGGGTHVTSVAVSLAAGEGAEVRFTLDGSEPGASSPRYLGPVVLVRSTTLRARAVHPDGIESDIVDAHYVVKVAKPTLVPLRDGAGKTSGVEARTSTPGATVHFTFDGSEPTEASPPVMDSRVVSLRSATVRARAFKPGLEPSEIAELQFESDEELGSSLVSCASGPAQIEAGGGFSVLLKPDGTVWTWGSATGGQLGDGTLLNRPSPAPVQGIPAIAALPDIGGHHVVVLAQDGSVWAWGDNDYGQVGDGSTTDRASPVQVLGVDGTGLLTDVVSVAVSNRHTLAVRDDGTVLAWGANGYGQLGDGTLTSRSVPSVVPNLDGIVAVAAGIDHSLALASDGTLWGWGRNDSQQLGDGTTVNRPTPVTSLTPPLVQITAGWNFSLATHFSRTGAVRWGIGIAPTAVGDLPGVRSIDAYEFHAVILGLDGRVFTLIDVTPSQVPGLERMSSVTTGGSDSLLGIDDDCVLWVLGSNNSGQLGDGTTLPHSTPFPLTGPDLEWSVGRPLYSPLPGLNPSTNAVDYITLTSATPEATIRYTVDGSVPDSSSAIYSGPIPIVATTTIRAFAAKEGMYASGIVGETYTMAIGTPSISPLSGTFTSPQTVTMQPNPSTGTVRFTTDGSDPTEESLLYTGPFQVSETTTIKAKGFMPGRAGSGITTRTYAFEEGTLTPPTISVPSGTYSEPQLVTLTAEPGTTILYSIDTGGSPSGVNTVYTGPILIDGNENGVYDRNLYARTVWPGTGYQGSAVVSTAYSFKVATPAISPTSGAYLAGQRATITTTTPGAEIHYTISGLTPTSSDRMVSSSPPLVLGDFTVTALAAKANYSNSDLASETFTITGSVATGEPATAPSVAASYRTSFVLTPAGNVWGWGLNNYGQLGDGTTTQRNAPVQVSNSSGSGILGGIVALAPGPESSLALASDGTVWAWGRNNYGQLGDGTTTQRTRPVQVIGSGGVGLLTDVVAIGMTDISSVALKSDGTVWAWGDNAYGQLGQNTTTDSLTPVQVKGVGGVGTLAGIVEIAADTSAVLALSSDGTLFGWGYNGGGGLGDNTTTNRLAPIVVPGMTGITRIHRGTDAASFALDSDGDWWGFGFNRKGQLGDETQSQRKTPVRVTAVEAAERLASDGDGGSDIGHTLALLSDDSVVVWGNNSNGELGDGTTTNSLVGIEVQGIPPVERAAAGAFHSMVLGTDGSVWAWGGNGYGQIGVGNVVTPVLTPVEIFGPGYAQKVATPTFNPVPGQYTTTKNVTIATSTSGATIRYTTDGSEPTSSSTLYSGAVAVTASLELRAKAFKAGLADSNTASGTYTLKVATPTFSPGTGTYLTSRSVAISCSVAGATIHYTTNGVDPTPSDPTIASGASVLVENTLTLKAKAWKSGWTESDVKSVVYNIKAAAPVLSPPGGSFAVPTVVTATSATPGVTLRFTTSGITPTENDAELTPAGYTVDRSMTFKVVAFRAGILASDVTQANYVLSLGTVADPTLTPSPGTFTEAQDVVLETTTPSATIRYTLDGSDPDIRSTVYQGPLSIDGDTTIRARAFRNDWIASGITAGN